MRRRLIAVKDSQCEKFMQYGLNAGGNTMGVYTMGDNSVNNGAVTLQEQHLYGSSRLGIQKPGLEVSSLLPAYSTEVGTTTKSIYSIFERGKKFFELSNHLGNVLATVSDKKYLLAANSTGNGGCAPGSAAEDVLVSLRGTETVYTGRSSVSLLPGFESSGGDNFEVYTDAGLSACNPATDNSTATSTVYAAEVVSAQDYAPFGMELVGRQYNASSYRYGFNGKENDNEVKGEGNSIDYGARVYDPRLGRFLSVDPLQKQFPWLTPYQYAGNSPIRFIDMDGLEPLDYSYNWKRSTEGTSKWNYNVSNVYDNWTKQTWTVMQYPNDNRIYYWKPYDGSHQTFNESTAKTNGTWNGQWQRFETQEALQAKYGDELATGISAFFAGGIAAGAAAGAVTGSGAASAIYYGAINVAARLYPYLPIAGAVGRKAGEMLDETGSVQAESGTGRYLIESVRDRLLKTSVNTKLLNWVDKLYRANAKIESGSTGDAIRHELQGGVLPDSKDHLQKAKEALNGMRDLLRENQGRLDGGDRKNVFEIIKDLTNGTGLDWKGVNYDYLKNKATK